MKILISVHVVWWNASAYYAVTAAQALERRGHDVTVLAHRSTPAFGEAQKRGLKAIGDFNLLRRNPHFFFRNRTGLAELIREEQFDILNPHRPEDHFYLALANRRAERRAKLVRTVSDVRVPSANVFNRWLHEKQTDGMIYCARCCFDRYHHRFQLDQKPRSIIYSTLDAAEYAEGDWKTGNPYLQLTSPRIGMVARLSPNKGHRTLIEAAVGVLKETPSASFLVAGKEEEVSVTELQDYVSRRGVAKAFTFAGHLADPRPVMAACDVGVIASTESEVISRAAQEFFAFGVPVVASRVNVLPEMVEDGVNGYLFAPGNAEMLVEKLLGLTKDPDLRRRLGEEARRRVRRVHDLRVQGEQTEALFDSVVVLAPLRSSKDRASKSA